MLVLRFAAVAPARLAVCAVAALAFLAWAAPGGAQARELLSPVIASVLAPPQPVEGSDGRLHLAYELQLTNRTDAVVTVRRVEALAGGRAVERLSGRGVGAVMLPYGDPGPGAVLKAGQASFVLMDVSLPARAKLPGRLAHRITVSLKPANPALATSYRTAWTRVVKRPPLVVAPPVRGPGWVVANGCCDAFTAHRGAILPVDGVLRAPERFAVDLVQIGPGGTLFQGSRGQLTDYPYFGDEVVSATAGRVVGVRDGLPETPGGSFPRGITAEDAGGNHVVVDAGGGRYAFYAHLQPGSIRVRVGQRLTVGQPLGMLGNSGNSDAPHLHFHVMDGPRPLGSNGLPFEMTGFRAEGTMTNLDAFEHGAVAKLRAKPNGAHRRQLPLDLSVVGFG